MMVGGGTTTRASFVRPMRRYKEVGALVAQVHGGYAALGLKTRDPVGIIGANSPEWMIALQVRAPLCHRALRRAGGGVRQLHRGVPAKRP